LSCQQRNKYICILFIDPSSPYFSTLGEKQATSSGQYSQIRGKIFFSLWALTKKVGQGFSLSSNSFRPIQMMLGMRLVSDPSAAVSLPTAPLDDLTSRPH
jgi:hypothetical protein